MRQLFFRMIRENLCHEFDAPCRRDVGQPDQARVRLGAKVNQRPEIGVDRHQNARVGNRAAEQRRIAGIATCGSDLKHIVPLVAQPVCQPASGAAVDQKPQAGATRTASILSSAIAAWAYARQALMSSASSSG